MKPEEFNKEMAKLVSVFGEKFYPSERIAVIYRIVSDLSCEWFSKTISQFIGNLERPPLAEKFQEESTLEREKIYSKKKEEYRRDAQDTYSSKFHPDEIAILFQTMITRIRGGVSDEHWESFKKQLTHAMGYRPRCTQCEDEGYIFKQLDISTYVYRCGCQRGRALYTTGIPIYKG